MSGIVSNNPETLKAALDYLKRGFSVIPLKARDKKPAILWQEFQTRQATEDEVDKWFRDSSFNIGIVTGEISGLVVVDFDTEEAIARAKKQDFPPAPLVKTGKGYHAYCRYEDGIRNFQKRSDLPGIDLRGEGGYVVAPPSIHPSGHQYRWPNGRGLDDVELPEIPEWILARNPEERPSLEELLLGVEQGGRNQALAQVAGSVIGKGHCLDDAIEFCLKWNRKCEPPLPEAEVKQTVKSIFDRHHLRAGTTESTPIWEAPIPLGNSQLPPLPRGLFPDWLENMIVAVAAFTETPRELAVTFGLAVLATCCQKRFVVEPKSGYREPLNVWLIAALGPGNRKTGVMGAMIAPLREWEAERAEESRQEIARMESERKTQEARIQNLRGRAAKAKEDDFDRLKREIAELEAQLPEPPKMLRLWSQDITPERTGSVMSEQGEKLTLLSDEGGLFDTLGGRYSGGIPNLDTYLQAHSGSPSLVDRGSRPPVLMQTPALTIGLSPQPEVLRSLADKPGFRGRGLLARFGYFLPVSTLGHRTLDGPPVPAKVATAYRQGVRALMEVEPPKEEGNVRPFVLSLSRAAYDEWWDFSNMVEGDLCDGRRFENITDWAAKLSGLTIRFAGLMHCAKYATGHPWGKPIESDTITQAISLGGILADHALEAFDLMGSDPALNGARKAWQWIERNRRERFSGKEMFDSLKGTYPRMANLRPALEVLKERGYIVRTEEERTGPGRPGETYIVNPKATTVWQ